MDILFKNVKSKYSIIKFFFKKVRVLKGLLYKNVRIAISRICYVKNVR